MKKTICGCLVPVAFAFSILGLDTHLRAETNASAASEPFSVSYRAGQRDDAGHFLGGTELMNLIAYKAQLYAGNGYGLDSPGRDPRPGPQLMLLKSPREHWRQVREFSGYKRLSALKVVTFTTDGQGKPMAKPVSRLVVGLTAGLGRPGAAFTWDQEHDHWSRFEVQQNTVRAFGFHRDSVTGADVVFLSEDNPPPLRNPDQTTRGMILSGVYDPASSDIRWRRDPEPSNFDHRVLAFLECDGRLFFASKPAVYIREDGVFPTWSKIYSYPASLIPKGSSGLRGLTCIADSKGQKAEILGVMEGAGQVLRINPRAGTAVTEFRIGQAVRKLWTTKGHVPTFYVAGAYNDMSAVVDPITGEALHLIGISIRCIFHDDCFPPGKELSAFYLTRNSQAQYQLFEVKPPSALGPRPPLIAVRVAVESPFPAEISKVLYLGGYDSYNVSSHNTAWIYRVGIKTALSGGIALNSAGLADQSAPRSRRTK